MSTARTAFIHLKRGLAACLCVLSVSILSAHIALAADKNLQLMTYDVYAGGFHVVEAQLKVDLSQKGRYDLSLDAHTRGFLANLAPWEGVFETQGWHAHQSSKPERHRSTTIWRDEEEIKTYNYNKNGSFKSYTIKEHDKPLETQDPAAELVQNSTDDLTATMSVMERIAAGGQCAGRDEIFDGKRRYRMIFNEEARLDLASSRYNVFQGSAVECTVEVQPVAGKWHDKPRGWMSIQEQGRARGTMPTVWMAQMAQGQPAVPVKIRVKTEYGVLFMHLTGYQSGDTVIALKD